MHCSRLAACTTSLTRAQAGRWLDDAHGPFGASLLVPLLGLGFLRSRARSDRPSETLSSRRHCTDRLLRGERLAPGVRPQTKLFAFRFSPLSTAMSPPGALTYDEVRSMSFSPQRLERALRPRSVHAVRRAAPPPPQLAQTRWDRTAGRSSRAADRYHRLAHDAAAFPGVPGLLAARQLGAPGALLRRRR